MNKKAFSLIELLVAGFVMVISAACFCGSLRQYQHYSARIEKERGSLTIAANKMEELRSLPFDSLPSFNGASLEGGRVSVTPADTDLLQVEVNGLITLRSKYQ